MNLLRRLQGELGLTYLFISHDLAVVRYMSHTLGVMYRGRIVEHGGRSEMFRSPAHSVYPLSWMDAIPVAEPNARDLRPTATLAQDVDESGSVLDRVSVSSAMSYWRELRRLPDYRPGEHCTGQIS